MKKEMSTMTRITDNELIGRIENVKKLSVIDAAIVANREIIEKRKAYASAEAAYRKADDAVSLLIAEHGEELENCLSVAENASADVVKAGQKEQAKQEKAIAVLDRSGYTLWRASGLLDCLMHRSAVRPKNLTLDVPPDLCEDYGEENRLALSAKDWDDIPIAAEFDPALYGGVLSRFSSNAIELLVSATIDRQLAKALLDTAKAEYESACANAARCDGALLSQIDAYHAVVAEARAEQEARNAERAENARKAIAAAKEELRKIGEVMG